METRAIASICRASDSRVSNARRTYKWLCVWCVLRHNHRGTRTHTSSNVLAATTTMTNSRRHARSERSAYRSSMRAALRQREVFALLKTHTIGSYVCAIYIYILAMEDLTSAPHRDPPKRLGREMGGALI